jgi:hypothetical protein
MTILIIYSECLQVHDSSEPFPDNTRALTIYRSWSSMVQMMIPSTYADSLQKIKFDEPIFIDIQRDSIFISAYF